MGGAYEHYLAHHGIIGQKWGVRRFQNEDGTLTAEGKARYLKDATAYGKTAYGLSDEGKKEFFDSKGNLSNTGKQILKDHPDSDEAKAIMDAQMAMKYEKKWLNSYNDAVDVMNKKLEEINKKYDGVDLENDENNLKYTMDVAKAWQESYGNILIRDYGEHPYYGREWLNSAIFYNQFDEEIEELKRKVKYPV